MQIIKLTNNADGAPIRMNPDHIVAYGPGPDGISMVMVSRKEMFEVKETADEIDKLLAELP